MALVVFRGNKKREQQLSQELREMLAILKKIEGVEKVILFGSMAGGEVGIKSDLDLVVVQKTDKRWLERAADLILLLNPKVAVDILVYTPEEFAELQEKGNMFFQKVMKEGRVVYEK